MSGHKRTTVTISQEEYRRLYDAEKRSYYETLSIPENVLATTIQSSQNTLMNSFHEIASRQNQYEKVLNQYHENIKDIEATTTQSLYEQQVDFYNQLMGMSDQVWKNTTNLIQIQNQEFEANVVSQNQHLFEQIQALDGRMSWFNNREEKLYLTSTNWLNDVQLLVNFIYSNYPREIIEEYLNDTLPEELSLVQRNIEDGFYEASLSISQPLFSQLSRTRLELENQLSQRSSLIQAIQDNLCLISECSKASQFVHPIDLNGDEVDDSIDVNYWTNNSLQKFNQEINALRQQINQTGIFHNPNELQQILEIKVNQLSEDLAEIVNQARKNALNSQLRYNVAQMVMIAVMNQGYQPQSGEYSEEDYRQGYLAKAVSADGSEIVVKVNPIEGYQNELQLISSQPGLVNESEMRKRSIEIIQTLNAYGLDVGKIEKVPENPRPQLPRKAKVIQPDVKKPALRRSVHG